MKPPPKPAYRSEPPTPVQSVKVTRVAEVAAVMDRLSDRRADDLTEIACLFADATEDEREVMLRVVRAVPRP